MTIQASFEDETVNAVMERLGEEVFAEVTDQAAALVPTFPPGTNLDADYAKQVHGAIMAAFYAGVGYTAAFDEPLAASAEATPQLAEFGTPTIPGHEHPELIDDGMVHIALPPDEAGVLIRLLLGGVFGSDS